MRWAGRHGVVGWPEAADHDLDDGFGPMLVVGHSRRHRAHGRRVGTPRLSADLANDEPGIGKPLGLAVLNLQQRADILTGVQAEPQGPGVRLVGGRVRSVGRRQNVPHLNPVDPHQVIGSVSVLTQGGALAGGDVQRPLDIGGASVPKLLRRRRMGDRRVLKEAFRQGSLLQARLRMEYDL